MEKPETKSIDIESSIESSIQTLKKHWLRRQKLKLLFSPKEQGIVSDNNNKSSWRIHIIKFLESTRVHAITISLLLVDLIMTVLELSSSLQSCSIESSHKPVEAKVEKYHWVGIAVLILLFAKTLALLVGQGIAFFKHPGHVVDGAVVMVALILEAFLDKEGGGLVVVVSLWRVVRVIESALELSDDAIEAQIEGILRQFEALKEENSRLSEVIAEKDCVIEMQQKVIWTLQEELD